MEIPLVSGILKRYRKRKQVRRLRNERMRLINQTVACGVTYDSKTSKFLCACCLQRICGRKTNRYLISVYVHAQKKLDAIDDQITALQE
jgi:hypothetical protein